jgi:RNA polymerase sigma-70 factor, ECF subfamily
MDIEAGLLGVARGERGAFSDLYRQLQPPMIRYVLGLLAGDRSTAEDVVNEAFVAVWQQAGQFSATGSAIGWVRRIARNKAIDWLRKQREVSLSSEAQDALFNQIPDMAKSSLEVMESESDAQELRHALAQLSLEHREVVWLCYFEDKSVSEIARIVECPENTVKTRLFYARKALRGYVTNVEAAGAY